MRTQEDPRHEGRWPGRRWWLGLLVWVVAIGWSAYLVSVDLRDGNGTFAAIVQTMGSIGILYALYLVTRSRAGGGPASLNVSREEVVPDGTEEPSEASGNAARWAIVMITLALAVGGLIYRLLQDYYLHQSAAFFVGVPAILAVTLALTPKAKSATGMIVKGLTLALLLSGVVFFEGFICILMAAPLFYLVGICIGIPIDRARRKKRSEGRVYSIVGAALVLLGMEGVIPATTFSQREVVRVTQIVNASGEAVRDALAAPPTFEGSLPFYLRLGFPRPVAGYGHGLDVGDTRTILFGTESPMEPMGDSHRHRDHIPADGGGVLELEVVRSTDGVVVFKPVEDATAFTHWISWGRSIVEWHALGDNTTQVTWTLHFKRRLSPAWYFGPWQRYAAERAAGYLIESVATP